MGRARARVIRMLREPAFAWVLAGLAAGLFCRPFLAEPRMPPGRAVVHLLAAWGLVIALLTLRAACLAPDDAPLEGGDDDV